MTRMLLENEVFALRHGERIQGFSSQPDTGEWICIMLRTVEMPAGDRQAVRPSDGAPVEQCAILACQLVDNKWQWLQLSAETKEVIGDHFFDSGAPRNQWLYLSITKE